MNRLQECRKKEGYTQSQFAGLIGISRQSVSLYENEKATPAIDIYYRMAKVLHTSIEYLAGYTDKN